MSELKLVPAETFVPTSRIRSIVRVEIQKIMNNVLAPAIADAIGAVRHEIEEGFKDAVKEFSFKGNWSEGVLYRQGNFVSMGGQVYHANFDNQNSRPGLDATNWSLAVKSGRDGHDGRNAPETPPPEPRTVRGMRSQPR